MVIGSVVSLGPMASAKVKLGSEDKIGTECYTNHIILRMFFLTLGNIVCEALLGRRMKLNDGIGR